MKALVVYMSRTGRCRQIATELAAELGEGAKIEEIEDLAKHSGVVGWLRAGRDSFTGKETPIGPASEDPAAYDVTVIGTPIWAGTMASPVKAYLKDNGAKAKRVAFWCTMGSSGGEKAFAQMAELCGGEPVATVEFRDKEIKRGDHVEPLKAFAGRIREAVEKAG